MSEEIEHAFCKNYILGDIYTGKGCGTNITKYIDDAKYRVWILSPYISPSLVKKLVTKSECKNNKNMDIRLITKEEHLPLIEEGFKKAMKEGIEKKEYIEKKEITINNALFHQYTINTQKKIFYFLKSHYMGREEYIENFHAKIFLIDGIFFIGSINFTEYGFKNNIETRFKSSDKRSYGRVYKFFHELCEDEDLITECPRCRCFDKKTSQEEFFKQVKKLPIQNWKKLYPMFSQMLEAAGQEDKDNLLNEILHQDLSLKDDEMGKYNSLRKMLDDLLILPEDVLNSVEVMVHVVAQAEQEKNQKATKNS